MKAAFPERITPEKFAEGNQKAIWRNKPFSVSIDDVTRKKINSINEISAVDVVFSSGICL